MCYEELFVGRWTAKRAREPVEPAAQGERTTPRTQPDRPKPESEAPRRPERERELEPV